MNPQFKIAGSYIPQTVHSWNAGLVKEQDDLLAGDGGLGHIFI